METIDFTMFFVLQYSTTNPAKNVSPAPETSFTGTSWVGNILSIYLQPREPCVVIIFSSNLGLLVSEYIYFSIPDSILNDKTAYEYRKNFGAQLA